MEIRKKLFLSFFGVILIGLATFFSYNFFFGENVKPPSLGLDSNAFQGLITTGKYLEFDEDDYLRVEHLPNPESQESGVQAFHASRDMSVLEISNAINPKNDLKVLFAIYGDFDNNGKSNFYTFPAGQYKDTIEIDEDNIDDFIVEKNHAFFLITNQKFETWEIDSFSDKPVRNFLDFDNLDKGWHLLSTRDLEASVLICSNRVKYLWGYDDDKFRKLDIDDPQLFSGNYVFWVYLSGRDGTCVDLSVDNGSDDEDETFVCDDEDISSDKSEICSDNEFIECLSNMNGTSIFQGKFKCLSREWVEQNLETIITVNSILPADNLNYEAGSTVILVFDQSDVVEGPDFDSITITKDGESVDMSNDKLLTTSGYLALVYDELDPDSEYIITIPENALAIGDNSNTAEIVVSFNTRAEVLTVTDTDGDGVLDDVDNCIDDVNVDQSDIDEDEFGDVCDIDKDNDGFTDDVDNCMLDVNPLQEDLDSDGIGDACDNSYDTLITDTDSDGDGILDDTDNCITYANPNQEDIDNDNLGDVCDPDKDGDGVLNTIDNCPLISNVNQVDADNDGIGFACDANDTPTAGLLSCVDNGVEYLDGENFDNDCNICVCNDGTVTCSLDVCNQPDPGVTDCSPDGSKNTDGDLCMGGVYYSCVDGNSSAVSSGIWTCDVSGDLCTSLLQGVQTCLNNAWVYTSTHVGKIPGTIVTNTDTSKTKVKPIIVSKFPSKEDYPVNADIHEIKIRYSGDILSYNAGLENLITVSATITSDAETNLKGLDCSDPLLTSTPASFNRKTSILTIPFENKHLGIYTISLPEGLITSDTNKSDAITWSFKSNYVDFLLNLKDHGYGSEDCKTTVNGQEYIITGCVFDYYYDLNKFSETENKVFEFLINDPTISKNVLDNSSSLPKSIELMSVVDLKGLLNSEFPNEFNQCATL